MYAAQLNPSTNKNDSRNKKKSNRQQNPSKIDNRNENNKKNSDTNLKDVADKFKEVQKKHIEAAKKHIEAYESSSEEELENNTLLDSVFKNYQGEKDQLKKTQDFLENVFQCNTAACLICIATVKRTDFIWSCENCYSFFHLNCIQRWAKDSTQLKKLHDENEGGYYNNLGEYIPKKQKVINWCCPKCRFEYEISEIPQHYFCFCKREINPPNHPWMVPHSCGEMCNKPLKSKCGHRCVLLCHPGDCPPCPQIITTFCECGSSQPRTIRCSQKSWKCANKCKRKLECGIHTCNALCHPPSQCPPCAKKSMQSCICGSKSQERNCNSLTWTCDKLCNKLFGCGAHRCKVKCHAGDCGLCPFGMPRSCPCGKELTEAPCSEEVGPCGNTCQKTLECGNHICAERCHKGNCSQCLEVVEKKCRCGLHTKEFPCSKQLTCETKCKKMRDCNKHACNRKCCNGQCPPCDKICGKVLSCGKHKCGSLCHNGLCYPCTQTANVRCRCGNTAITVPCGREKKTKPPKCNLPCKIPSKCHHTNYHKCHINECPVCVQPCMLANDTTKCNHPCAVRCHDAVKVQIIDKNYKPSTPWEVQPEKFEIKKMPHPSCEIKVSVECIGGHETTMWPCWNSKPMSCGRKCGRKLKCGNHVCELTCHVVENKGSVERDRSCLECSDGCHIPRPQGCTHRCQRSCHLPPCELCEVTTKTSCHCGLTQIYYKCGKFYRDVAPEEEEELKAEQEAQLSCGNRCIKNFPCGHRCTNLCHTGQCINAEFCKKKLKVYCECKTKKIETTCDKVRSGFVLNCDEVCKAKQLEIQKTAEEAERIRRQQEEEKNRLEIEEFEKKFAKKKYKERKKQIIETENNQHLLKWFGLAIGVAVLGIFASYLLLAQ